MIILKAPYPLNKKVLILPNPKLGDSETAIRNIDIKRGIDGTTYSYVKTTSNLRLLYTIEMTRQKSLELELFFKNYAGNKWELVDHNNVKYVVISVTSLTKQGFKRSWYNPTDPRGSEEAVTINMELEGTRL